MRSRSRLAFVVGVVLVLAALVGDTVTPGRTAPAPEPIARPRTASAAAQIAGTASCSGRGCHGAIEPNRGEGIQQNEFITWLSYDKHAQAYEVLKGERAQRMARNLGIESAEKDARCLACHTIPQLAGSVSEEQAALRSDGVSCEACHGPAKGTDPWLTAHTLTSWKKSDEKSRVESFHAHGMTPLFDLEVQAKTCAGCHVGAPADPEHGIPARDLNHDLMAAGHPRLTFELGTFRANMPHHWRSSLHKDIPGFEARVWAVGQVASAKAALELLEHRATQAAAQIAPWPEFAEASCYACHANLRESSANWRRNAAYYAGRRPGAIPLNRWYTVLLPSLESIAAGKAAPANNAFQALAKEMNKSYPDPSKVTTLAKMARSELAALLDAVKRSKFDEASLKKLSEALARQTETSKEPDWDDATQTALAAAAIRDALSSDRNPEKERPLNDIFRDLAFPPSYESPENYSPRMKDEGQTDDLHTRLVKILQAMAR
jgi:hypothetical protein